MHFQKKPNVHLQAVHVSVFNFTTKDKNYWNIWWWCILKYLWGSVTMSVIYFEMNKIIRCSDRCKEGRIAGVICDEARILMIKSR